MGIQIDTIMDGKAQGDVAKLLLQSDFNPAVLRTNDVLQKDEWKHLDKSVIGIARQRLVGVGAVAGRGLVYPVANAMGTTMIEWETADEMTPANINMSGVTEGDNDRLTFSLQGMPLPIIHKDFFINARVLEASRKSGQALDASQAIHAAILVSEAIEGMLFSGRSAINMGGRTIVGLENAPNRNTGSVTANWDTLATGEQMVADIIAMIGSANADHMYGPFGIFVPLAAYNRMAEDYKAASDKTILSRLMEIPNLAFILPSSNVTAGAVLMTQLTADVIDIVDGMQPTIIQWSTHGGLQLHFKVMAIMAPRIRSTKTNQSGVVHYS